MTAYLVRLVGSEGHSLRYLSIRPMDKTWGWFSGDCRHATPVSFSRAERLAGLFRRNGDRVEVVIDPRHRPVFDDVDLLREQLVAGR